MLSRVHRRPLLEMLDRYAARHPTEASCAARIRALVSERPDCFERSCLPGHITSSAWIVSSDYRLFLLTHHRKLDRWLQLGGHADGDPDALGVALREAREESGMHDFHWPGSDEGSSPLPLDLDVHVIPARPGEPAHEHHDLRFLLVAAPDQTLRISAESKRLAWYELARLEQVVDEESLLRMGLKARALLGV
jgi:8-oxo-dGTP pyrophosphatase MutT (NUDIX family)